MCEGQTQGKHGSWEPRCEWDKSWGEGWGMWRNVTTTFFGGGSSGFLHFPVWESPDPGSDGALETPAIVAEGARSEFYLTLIKMWISTESYQTEQCRTLESSCSTRLGLEEAVIVNGDQSQDSVLEKEHMTFSSRLRFLR